MLVPRAQTQALLAQVNSLMAHPAIGGTVVAGMTSASLSRYVPGQGVKSAFSTSVPPLVAMPGLGVSYSAGESFFQKRAGEMSAIRDSLSPLFDARERYFRAEAARKGDAGDAPSIPNGADTLAIMESAFHFLGTGRLEDRKTAGSLLFNAARSLVDADENMVLVATLAEGSIGIHVELMEGLSRGQAVASPEGGVDPALARELDVLSERLHESRVLAAMAWNESSSHLRSEPESYDLALERSLRHMLAAAGGFFPEFMDSLLNRIELLHLSRGELPEALVADLFIAKILFHREEPTYDDLENIHSAFLAASAQSNDEGLQEIRDAVGGLLSSAKRLLETARRQSRTRRYTD